jgi:hypothetical protein
MLFQRILRLVANAPIAINAPITITAILGRLIGSYRVFGAITTVAHNAVRLRMYPREVFNRSVITSESYSHALNHHWVYIKCPIEN